MITRSRWKILQDMLVLLLLLFVPSWLTHSGPDTPASLLFPPSHTLVVQTPSTTITAEYDTGRVQEIVLLRPFEARRSLSIGQPEKKMAFARELYTMIPKDILLSDISMHSNRDSLGFRFPLQSQMDLTTFWKSEELNKIWTAVHHPKAMVAEMVVHGWTASTFHSTPEIREKSKNYFSLSVSLTPGLNSFQLMLLDSGRTPLLIDSLSIFYTIPTLSDSPPDNFEKQVFHGSSTEEQCVSCHADISTTCSSCHRGLLNLPSVHPIAEDCSMCHDLSSGGESHLIEDQEFNSEFCFTCHDTKKEDLETKPVVHGTATECLMCHNPHGSTYATMVRDRTTNICIMCHDEKAREPHPVDGHPLEGLKDPYRPGKKLTCTSCHDPHASDHAKLFRFPTLPICKHCHGKG